MSSPENGLLAAVVLSGVGDLVAGGHRPCSTSLPGTVANLLLFRELEIWNSVEISAVFKCRLKM